MRIPSLPKSNAGAAWGAVLAALGLAVIQGWFAYVQTGQPFPTTSEGWVRLLTTIVGGAAIAVLVPRFSVSEARTGYRTVNSPPDGSDAPVISEAKAHQMERDALRKESQQR